METKVHYVKPDNEVYVVRKNDAIDEVRKISLWVLVPFLLLCVLGVYMLFSGLSIEETGQTTYDINARADYQVYLKENDYYGERYLPSGKQYITNLIDTIRVDFDYQFEADAKVDANYVYEIIATAKATEKNDKTKILYEQSFPLVSGTLTEIVDNKFVINEAVNIDYSVYSDLMRNFRSDLGVAANCFLDLRMVVKIDGMIGAEDALVINIPLSDQTIDIDIDTAAIDRSEKLGEARREFYVKNSTAAVLGGVIVFASVVAMGIVIYLYVTRFGNNWYAEAEYKIFKNYDTRIVNIAEDFFEPEDTVRVSSFIELLDASENEGAPIQYYDVDPNYKSYFVVKGMNTTYRYTLSREYQDELRRNRQKKEF